MADAAVPLVEQQASSQGQDLHADLLEVYNSQSEADVDSAYGDIQSSTESVTSSIFAGRIENGRRYHAYGSQEYIAPDDEREQDRLDMKYAALNLVLGDKTLFCPVKDPQQILDVGTGTGIWAIDCGEEYPGATVTANDLSPIQPSWVPPNVKFEIDDAEATWTYDHNFFDVVHTRTVMTAGIRNWEKYIEQAFTALKPGGYLEAQEMDYQLVVQPGSINPGENMLNWNKLQLIAAAKARVRLRFDPSEMKEMMERAGFVDIVVRDFKLPTGPWPADRTLRNAGLLQMSGLLDGIEGISLRMFVHVLGWSVEELQILLAKCRTEMKDKRFHSYWPVYVVYGRKPE